MIYQINGFYYVKVGSKYVKLIVSLDKKGEVVMTPTKEKLEHNNNLKIKPIDFQKEKANIAKTLRSKTYNDYD